MNKIGYLVYVKTGSYDDVQYDYKFVTLDESKAEYWINKFNKIISDYKSRIYGHYDDNDYSKQPLFWHDFVTDKPIAYYKQIEVR